MSRSASTFVPAPRRKIRCGITIIELLIAVALTLIIVGAMVRAFKLTSDEISSGRAQMQCHSLLRTVSETLRRDLQMATCLPKVSSLHEEVAGGFEVVEGEEDEKEHTLLTANSHLGDHDDILWLTVRSSDKPFRGRFNGNIVESNLAEITWWVVHDDTNSDGEAQYDENVRLYRRVLLMRPDLDVSVLPLPQQTNFDAFYQANDVSVRRDPSGPGLLMNSLSDLSNRRNRFAHDTGTFPHEFLPAVLDSRPYIGNSEGEDLVLDNCVAFDIRVFSPNAPVVHDDDVPPPPVPPGQANPQVPYLLEPSDDGFGSVPPAWITANGGAYVDLGFDGTLAPSIWFSSDSAISSQFVTYPKTWCSWFPGYEFDGIDQDSDGIVDEGTDGVDNDGANGIDDALEREAPPPYAEPLRSIQISIRVIEKRSNTIKQTTVKESFVPN
jgi:type II secretory pathway component PulJ